MPIDSAMNNRPISEQIDELKAKIALLGNSTFIRLTWSDLVKILFAGYVRISEKIDSAD